VLEGELRDEREPLVHEEKKRKTEANVSAQPSPGSCGPFLRDPRHSQARLVFYISSLCINVILATQPQIISLANLCNGSGGSIAMAFIEQFIHIYSAFIYSYTTYIHCLGSELDLALFPTVLYIDDRTRSPDP
jgi:hypothetical protein